MAKILIRIEIGGQHRVLTGRFVAVFLLPLQMEASKCRSASLGGPKSAILSEGLSLVAVM